MTEAPAAAHKWTNAAGLVGQTIDSTVGPDAVTLADIRRKLEVIGLDCPLHYDSACAQSPGYRTVVSPVSMTRIWSITPTWRPGEPRPGSEPLLTLLPSAHPPGHGGTLIAAHLATEHHEPVYPGDRITGTAVLRKVTPTTTRVGTGAFLEIETTYCKQDDTVLTVERATLFRFDRPDGSGAPLAPVETATPSDRGSRIRDWGKLGARIRTMEFAMKGHNCVGDVVTMGGAVIDKHTHQDEHRVRLKLWIDCPRGRTVIGSAVVALPTRRHT
jgi:acyl dehydratase